MKHLETIDEIQEYFAHLVNGEELNSKMTLARIYGAAERYIEDDQRTSFIDEAFQSNESVYILEKTFICKRLSIAKIQIKMSGQITVYYVPFVDNKKYHTCVFSSFELALIGGICVMYKSEDAGPYIMRMLRADKVGE